MFCTLGVFASKHPWMPTCEMRTRSRSGPKHDSSIVAQGICPAERVAGPRKQCDHDRVAASDFSGIRSIKYSFISPIWKSVSSPATSSFSIINQLSSASSASSLAQLSKHQPTQQPSPCSSSRSPPSPSPPSRLVSLARSTARPAPSTA
jgi:hypothetical protein